MYFASTDGFTIFDIVLCIFSLKYNHYSSMGLPSPASLMTYCNVRYRNMEEIAIYMEMGFQLVFNLSIRNTIIGFIRHSFTVPVTCTNNRS